MPSNFEEPEKLREQFVVSEQDSDDESSCDPASLADSCFPIGTTFAGHYEIVDVLGQGGMSSVYKARHLLVDGFRAIKVIRADKSNNTDVIQRFQREGKAALALEHPNIGRVYEFGIEPTLKEPYLVMEYIEGETLADILRKEGALPEDVASRLIVQICEGLSEAHSKGVVHRDLKPGNIIVTRRESDKSGVAKIVDFGIAKIVDQTEGQDLTQTGEVFGTPLYMSPEQCRGQKVDDRSDIYSLGCVLYQCLTGKPPYPGSTSLETIMMHVDPDCFPSWHGNISPHMRNVIKRCLSTNPDDRFRSSKELIAALSAPAPPLKAHLTGVVQSARGTKNGRLVAVAMLTTLIVTIAFFSLSSTRVFWNQKEAQKMKRQLISEKQNDPITWIGIARDLEKDGDFVDAERALRKSIQLKASKQAWTELARILEKQGRAKEASDALEQAAKYR